MITCIRRSDGLRFTPAEVREMFPVVNRKGPLAEGERTPWGYKVRPTVEELDASGVDRETDNREVVVVASESGSVESYKFKAELRAQGLFDPVAAAVFQDDDNMKDAGGAAFFHIGSMVSNLVKSTLILNDVEVKSLLTSAPMRQT